MKSVLRTILCMLGGAAALVVLFYLGLLVTAWL